MELPKSPTGRAARTEAINKCLRLPGPPPLCRSQDSSPETRLPARTLLSDRRKRPRLSVKPYPHLGPPPAPTARPSRPFLPGLPCWRAAGPVEGLPAPGSRRGGGCPVSTPARLLQRRLAEFSVGEAHQAAAVTAGPAYGSHLRGTGGRRQARCGGRGLELRRGRRSPAEAERRRRTRASAQQETSGRSCGAACSAAETAPPRRACALPPPPAWRAATRRGLGCWAYCV